MRGALVACVVVAVSSVPGSGRAEGRRAEAARLFDRGVALLASVPAAERGLRRHAPTIEAALGYFQRSLAVMPSFSSRVNAAEALYLLGRHDEAHALYVTLVAEHSAKLEGSLGDTIRGRIAEIGAQLVAVGVRGEPGASLSVDDRPRGELPLTGPLFLLPGTRRISARKDGFEPFTVMVQVSAPRTSVDIQLQRSPSVGRVVVTDSAGGDVDVMVDGARAGPAPRALVLSAGRHLIWLDGPVDGSLPQAIVVVEGADLEVQLRSAPVGARRRVTVAPASATWTVEGAALDGTSEPPRWPRAGARVIASEPGYVTSSHVVSGDDEGPVLIELEPDASHPRWRRPTPSTWSLGAVVAALAGPGLRGDTGGAPAWGASAEVQAQLAPRGVVRLEASAGYLALTQSGPRHVDAGGGLSVLVEDEVALRGPLLAVGARAPAELGRWIAAPGLDLGLWLPTATSRATATARRADGASADLSMSAPAAVTRATPFARIDVRIGRRAGALEWALSIGLLGVPWMGGRWQDREAFVSSGPACDRGDELRCLRGTTAASSGRVHRAFVVGSIGAGIAWGR